MPVNVISMRVASFGNFIGNCLRMSDFSEQRGANTRIKLCSQTLVMQFNLFATVI